jgi:hypothetical protein
MRSTFRSVTTTTIKPTTNTNIRDLRCPAIVFNKTKHTSTEYPKRNFYTISSAISLVVIAFHPHNHHLDAQHKTGLVSSDKPATLVLLKELKQANYTKSTTRNGIRYLENHQYPQDNKTNNLTLIPGATPKK